jgi:DNA-binding NtrC family response regulator
MTSYVEVSVPTTPSEVQSSAPASLLHRRASTTTVQRYVRALLVSPRLEVRKALLQVLESLSADVTCCTNRVQAEEVLAHQRFEVVFCDEHLPDGSYADLIHADHFEHRIPCVIVATRVGEWEFYFEALRKGAFDVVRAPWYATDVEMTVIRALHEEDATQAKAKA